MEQLTKARALDIAATWAVKQWSDLGVFSRTGVVTPHCVNEIEDILSSPHSELLPEDKNDLNALLTYFQTQLQSDGGKVRLAGKFTQRLTKQLETWKQTSDHLQEAVINLRGSLAELSLGGTSISQSLMTEPQETKTRLKAEATELLGIVQRAKGDIPTLEQTLATLLDSL